MHAEGSATGFVDYWFSPVTAGSAPFTPATVPVLFETSGGVSGTTGSSGLAARADVGIAGFPDADFRAIVSSGPGSASFDQALILGLTADSQYLISLVAGCGATNVGSGSSTCNAWVDPVLTFDQAAFDTAYGPDAFLLTDYYSLGFSPNVSFQEPPGPGLPEPPLVALLAIGMAGLRSAFRRQAGSSVGLPASP